MPFLAKERDILGVGVETVGTDAGQAATFDPMFPCHTIMHGSNRFGLASLMNLDQLPATGAVVIAPPLKIVNGSGSPLRVLALVPGCGSRWRSAWRESRGPIEVGICGMMHGIAEPDSRLAP